MLEWFLSWMTRETFDRIIGSVDIEKVNAYLEGVPRTKFMPALRDAERDVYIEYFIAGLREKGGLEERIPSKCSDEHMAMAIALIVEGAHRGIPWSDRGKRRVDKWFREQVIEFAALSTGKLKEIKKT